MRSPSPQLAGSKRDSSGEVLEASAWKRHMVENFGCEIETGECHRPICVNPQHLLVNGDIHDDLHRHKGCLVPSSHHENPAPSRHPAPLVTVAADICTESSCHVAGPHSSSDSRCEGMFWDSCSPTCSGDEACPVPDACADPNCDLQDVCWDNLCTQNDCNAAECPENLCLVDEQSLAGFFESSELGDMGFKGLDPFSEPPSKKIRECSRLEYAERALFGSNGALPDISEALGVAQSVEEGEHICLWKTSVKQEDDAPALCNMKFASSKDLADHMKEEHTEGADGKYCCQWHGCTSSTDFKQSGKLARHFAIHSKSTQLKGHIQGTHLKEKRFQCKLCDFCCTDSSNLTKHENGVHGRKEYRCPHLGCTAPVTSEWSVIRKHFKESGHCPELLESNSQAQKKFKKAAVVKDQAGVMANGRRAPISRNRTKRSETAEQKVKSESVEPAAV
ncbi:Zinc finger C2H2-type protein [Neofusicoccum parvum]|nr:Zinc finger C2H2-type protein [Neofusicoccum parvum]